MPDPGVQRGGSFDDTDFDASIESGGVDLNKVAAAISSGPLESAGIGGVGRTILGALIPGIGLPDLAHGAAKAIGGGISSIISALGLESTAPAIVSGPESIIANKEGDSAFSKITQAADRFNIAQQQSGSLGLASNLSAGISGSLLPTLQALSGTQQPNQVASAGIGEQIIKTAGIEKLKEMLAEGGGDKKTAKEKATPTQQTNKPVEGAKKEREEGRSFFEQLFLDLINGELNV